MKLNKYKVLKSFGTIETHEVFLDSLAHQREEEGGFSEKRLEVKIRERLIYFIFGVFCVISLIFFARSFYFQVVHGRELYSLSQSNKGKINLIRAERGIIYDRNFKKLVFNAPAYDLVCATAAWRQAQTDGHETNHRNLKQEIEIIASITGKDAALLEQDFMSTKDAQIVAADNISQQQLLVLEASMHKLVDCKIEKNTSRSYASGPVFSSVLGYMGRINKSELSVVENYNSSDNIGKDGLEKFYESYLRGIPGRTEIIKTAKGVVRGDKIITKPVQGHNLVLNIDSGLQKAVYDSLAQSIKNVGAKRGAAVALNPNTGAVLALVSYPSYDNNIFSAGVSKKDFDALISNPNQPFFNRAIAAKYPTGSTIKPFLAAAALQEGVISPSKLINDPGFITLRSQNDASVTYTFTGIKPHGLVDMRRALAVSSNIYFFTIGGGYGDQRGLGPSRIHKYLSFFGWEKKTGIDLPGEFSGFIPTPAWKKEVKNERWWDGDTYNLSIGQSDLQVTPLHVAVAYAAIANGGTLYKPQIVSKIVDTSAGEQTVVKEFHPEITGHIGIEEPNLKVVREGMRDGVAKSYGSSALLATLPVPVAGKTGTVETGREGVFNTWSSNFAPYDNPQIVFVATIEGVQGLRAATLPVAYDALQHYFGNDNRQ